MPSCSRCQSQAVLRLDYANLDLCGACFSGLFVKRVAKANRDFAMLDAGDVVAVGVSGGKDSAALLYSLWKLSKKTGFSLKPIVANEGIAGYRDEAMKDAHALCRRLGLELTVVAYQDLAGHSMDDIMKIRDEKALPFSSCGVCGVLRKDGLNKAARKVGATKLAIGHNTDDVAQTVLMNLMRGDAEGFGRFGVVSSGSGSDSLVPRVKPLVYNLEKECALYCVVNDLPFHLAECPYSAEAFRGPVKDFLNNVEQKHPGTKFKIVSAFLKLKQKLPAPKEWTATAGACALCGAQSSAAICRRCVLVDSLG
ncbi:MAG: TIGR00269 family protein [Candidatus Micrarchaeota archaeon]|nr:TIGR00269 family protein [Candidatus Micrarchaeota archaeon]